MFRLLRQWMSGLRAGAAAGAAVAQPPAARAAGIDPGDIEVPFVEQLLGTQPLAGMPLGEFEAGVLDELDCLVETASPRELLLPRLPAVLPELLATLRDPDVTVARLARVIARDPNLVAAVARVVNSAYMRRERAVSDLQEAVFLLGRDGIRRLLPVVLVRPVFHAGGGRFSTLAGPLTWSHAQRCAHAVTALAPARTDAFDLYLAGLALGAGLVVAVRVMDRADDAGEPLRSRKFARGLLQAARRLGGSVARQWEFPRGTRSALAERLALPAGRGDGRLLADAEFLAAYRALARGGRLRDDVATLAVALPAHGGSALQQAYAELLRYDEAEPLD